MIHTFFRAWIPTAIRIKNSANENEKGENFFQQLKKLIGEKKIYDEVDFMINGTNGDVISIIR